MDIGTKVILANPHRDEARWRGYHAVISKVRTDEPEVLPKYQIRFPGGSTMDAWSEEIQAEVN